MRAYVTGAAQAAIISWSLRNPMRGTPSITASGGTPTNVSIESLSIYGGLSMWWALSATSAGYVQYDNRKFDVSARL